jgi:hypothetical protein
MGLSGCSLRKSARSALPRRPGNAEQEAFQLVEACFRMRHTQRACRLACFIDDHDIMVAISSIDNIKGR